MTADKFSNLAQLVAGRFHLNKFLYVLVASSVKRKIIILHSLHVIGFKYANGYKYLLQCLEQKKCNNCT